MNETLIAKAEEQAQLCRVFSNSCRVLILWALEEGELPVTEIATRVGSTIQNVSQHLSLLKQHGLISARREAQHIYYHLNESPWLSTCPAMKVPNIREINISNGGI
ncbi:MAG TPA: metalloregulator ArsR/SmtB family transcription factor [Anaerolineales bacterium]|nr:metalloregulator ArsR/SmtB family transcription factor [Anaerolineales bacterium]